MAYLSMRELQPELFAEFQAAKRKRKRMPITVLDRAERKIVAEKIIAKANVLKRSLSLRSIRRGMRLENEANNYVDCGAKHILWQCNNDKRFYHTRLRCHSRICGYCTRTAFNRVRDSLDEAISACISHKRKGYYLSLLTLTVNTSRFENGFPGVKDLERFNQETAAFFRLYFGKWAAKMTASGKVIDDKTRFSYKTVSGKRVKVPRSGRSVTNSKGKTVTDYRRYRGAGYISTIEVAPDNNNLHCHAVVYGPYVPQPKLVESWSKITQDSRGVDIRAVWKKSEVLNYVMKYISKPMSTNSYTDLANYVEMIKGVRRLRAGGIFFNRIKKSQQKKVVFACPECSGSLLNLGSFEFSSDEIASIPNLYDALRARAAPGG